jgi:O-methyltransferase involved in polyketide biosynthesis
MPTQQKDYSSISPSAKSLLLLKGYTNIPFAKETAALMDSSEVFDLSFDETDFWFWIRVMHFELRYWSIDQLLRQTDSKNILELSSGFSFRGIDFCNKNAAVHYIDSDLPDLVAVKRQMIEQLKLDKNLQGTFELLPLNAMDEAAFRQTVQRFGEGPLSIINEGLLMYLNTEEKTRLCQTIHGILKARGGCWITADVYVKRSTEMRAELPLSKGERAFLEQHNIEENKFDTYNAAEAFFKEMGFELIKEAEPDYASLSVMPMLMKVLPEEVRNSKERPPKIQATWMLRAV